MANGETPWPTTELEGLLDDEVTAARLGHLLEHRSEWVHRRVESVGFHDDISVRRRISLDFTLPAFAPGFVDGHDERSLVPLTFLQKRPLMRFDVFEESGRVLPILNTDQNQTLASRLLLNFAEAAVGKGVSPAIEEELRYLAGASTETGSLLLEAVRARAREDPRGELGRVVDGAGWWLDALAHNFMLVALLPAPLGERRVVKFSYDQPISLGPDRREVSRRLKDRLGWNATTVEFPIPSLGHAQSFHFEVAAPPGSAIVVAALGEHGGEPLDFVSTSRRAPRDGRPRVHLHSRATARKDPRAAIALRPLRRGWLRTVLVTAWLVAILMSVSAVQISRLLPESSEDGQRSRGSCIGRLGPMSECSDDESDRGDESVAGQRSAEAAALLLALPGVLAVVLTRHGEHPMTTHLLAGIRPVILTTALVLFIGAWTVVFLPTRAVTGVWYGLSVAACILAGLLTVSYIGLRPRGNGGE